MIFATTKTRAVRRFAAVFGLALGVSAFGQIPDGDQIRRDLNTIYAAQVANPVINAEGLLAKRLRAMMFQQARYLISTLKSWRGKDGALTLTSSGSDEHGIRPNTHTVFGLAALYRAVDGEFGPGLSKTQCLEKAQGLLRFVLYAHGAGGLKCADGKPWRDQWQSALWANSAGLGCWLLWDELNSEMRWLAARMICDEADRFTRIDPPSQILRDTKAEENAWNSTIVTLAYCMFPKHPNSELWRETAIRWILSSFARQADLASATVYDGKPLREWLTGASIHDDYTLENHDRVHPDYMNTINIVLDQWMPYEWSGKPEPRAFDFNTKQVYATLKSLTFPDGGYVYTNGQDWQLHRNPQWLITHLIQSVKNKDKAAALMAQICLETGEKMQARNPDGGVFLPEEFSFPSTQQYYFEMLTDCYLLVRSKGEGATPVAEVDWWENLKGTYLYKAGSFGLLRTEKSVSSFSWGRQVMGMVFPVDKDLLINPNERSMIGYVTVDGDKKERPVMGEHKLALISGAFGISGVMERARGKLSQRFGFLALEDGRSVYVDEIRATSITQSITLNLGTMGVLNDKSWVYHDGSRYLYHTDGRHTFKPRTDPASTGPLQLRSPWYNVDDKLGILCMEGSGRQTYDPNITIRNGRLEQLFHLNAVGNLEGKTASTEPLARTVLVYYPGQKNSQTRTVAEQVKLQKGNDSVYSVTLEDSKRLTFDLTKLTIQVAE